MLKWPIWCLVAGLLAVTGPSRAQEPMFFRIASAAAGGIYFPVATLLGQAISSPPGSRPCDRGGACGVPGLIANVQSSEGSIANVTAIQAGDVESGLSQADVAYWAYTGAAGFKGQPPMDKLRAIAHLYSEHVHVVARADARITGFGDLKGKRIAIGLPASGAITGARVVLKAAGLDEKRNFKPLFVNIADSVAALREDRADAMITVAGYPSPAIADLAANAGAAFLPITGPLRDKIRDSNPFYLAGAIPAGTYKGTNEDVPTLTVGALWVTSASHSTTLVYDITKALWHPSNRKLLDSGHEKGQSIRLVTAVEGLPIPLHPGAERYYREVGLLK
jgi:uncharacterized protein